jgi:drug/metabolite transporter (DMT)-like permease
LKTFFKYLVINLVLIPIYILLFFMAAMGLGGRTGTESNVELMYNIFLFSTVGIIPNAIVFLVSFIRKKNIKPNAIWAAVFSLIMMVVYMLAYFVAIGM